MATVTLIPATGLGEVNANSYATADEFDTYMFRIPAAYKTAFTAVATDIYLKEQVLIWATQLLKNHVLWPDGSYRKYETQALDFPRLNLVDQDGFLVGEASVPSFIKDATCQLAFELLKSDLNVEPTRGLNAITVGPISLDFDTQHLSNVQRVIPRAVMAILWPYGAVLRGSPRVRSVPLYRA